MFIDNLYENIITADFKKSDRITILSGYASGSFLKKVLKAYPDLKIDLYLGMTHEGVSISSHQIFQDLTENNLNINVYYQINGPPNHMKIYSLFNLNEQRKSFVGSANFTENGFEYNKEILVEGNLDFTEVFDIQRINSLICTDMDIEKYVNIYSAVIEELICGDSEVKGKDSSVSDSEKYNPKSNKLISMRNKANHKYYKEFEIEIVKSNDKNWEFTGINNGLYGGKPHITIGNTLYRDRVFPRDTEFSLITGEDKEHKVRVSAKNRDALYFVDEDIYEYFRKKLGWKQKKPISHGDLEAVYSNHVKFIRLDKLKYFIEFY